MGRNESLRSYAKEVRSPRRAAPVVAKRVLEMALHRNGLDEKLARYDFVLRWEEIVGKEIAKRTRPECLRNGTLVVTVDNAIWAQELIFYKDVILKRLRRVAGKDELIRDVCFYVDGRKR